MISVVIPAHNEASLLGASLTALLSGEGADELDVVVVCNGCTDRTADVASEHKVRVLELETASKTAALNAGDQASRYFPRFYVDADILVTAHDIVRSARALTGEIHAVSPVMRPILEGRPRPVQDFYRIWTMLPYCKSLIGSGVFGLDKEARQRFSEFPPVIADDLFARLQVRPNERRTVEGTSFGLRCPKTLGDLVKVKTRSHLGSIQLRELYPELWLNEDVDHKRALLALTGRPRLWPSIVVYVGIRALSRARATYQHRRGHHHRWERDESSRKDAC